MSVIKDLINRIFDQKVIIKKLPSGRLRTIDFNKLQSMSTDINGNYKSARSTLSGNSFIENSGYFSGTDYLQIENLRQLMYIDYEQMDADAILSAALDIYADECTVRNEAGRLLTIKTDDPKKKALLHNLFYDVLNIEFNLWYWIRSLAKYGDLFLYLKTIPSIGVVDAIPIHPSLIRRDEYSGKNKDKTQFIYQENSSASYTLSKNILEFYEVAHFRILTDTLYLPYGKSMLEGARKIWKQLSMMEDAMLIHRIMRAPERRIFKLDIGNLPDNAIDQHIEAVANQMKKIPYIDPQTGDYNLRFNLMNMLEDFFLPTRGGDSSTDITTLEGLSNDGSLEDIEYLRTKMMAFLKIPKAYLGYDEGVEGKGTLAAEDIKFARFIERIQRIVVSELEKIAYIHLFMQGYRNEDLVDFSLQLSTPSIIYERQKIDLWNEKTNLAGSLKDHGLFSFAWIYENIYGLTPDEWKNESDRVIEDKKREFRLEQIKNEGNDPAVSKKSFGTPHDIVSMQMAAKAGIIDKFDNNPKSLWDTDGRINNPGRPEKYGSYGTEDDNTLGKDPFGQKSTQPSFNLNMDFNNLIKSMENNMIQLNEKVNDINTDDFKET